MRLVDGHKEAFLSGLGSAAAAAALDDLAWYDGQRDIPLPVLQALDHLEALALEVDALERLLAQLQHVTDRLTSAVERARPAGRTRGPTRSAPRSCPPCWPG